MIQFRGIDRFFRYASRLLIEKEIRKIRRGAEIDILIRMKQYWLHPIPVFVCRRCPDFDAYSGVASIFVFMKLIYYGRALGYHLAYCAEKSIQLCLPETAAVRQKYQSELGGYALRASSFCRTASRIRPVSSR
jgi:hypothetical protein